MNQVISPLKVDETKVFIVNMGDFNDWCQDNLATPHDRHLVKNYLDEKEFMPCLEWWDGAPNGWIPSEIPIARKLNLDDNKDFEKAVKVMETYFNGQGSFSSISKRDFLSVLCTAEMIPAGNYMFESYW